MRKLLLLLSLLALITSCEIETIDGPLGDSQNNDNISAEDRAFMSENFGAEATADFFGKVLTGEGYAMSYVTVVIGDESTQTDVNGIFRFNNVVINEKFAYIRTFKDGYINGSKAIVPRLNSINNINIVMLQERYLGRVDSGEPSTVDRFGTTINFSGDFIDENGNPYDGQVTVNYYKLGDNSNATPGMLFGSNINNQAVAMETFGMIKVSLYGDNDQKLNIAPDSPATIELPIADSLIDQAVMNMNVWYFDENVGYWKEEGMAVKQSGNYTKYVFQVNHFTWWNCDLPLDYVTACFTVETPNESPFVDYNIRISRTSTNQSIYQGLVNNLGEECGLFPANEEVSVQILESDNCSTGFNPEVLYEEILPSIQEGDVFNIVVPDQGYNETLVTADVVDCSGNPITDGYAVVSNDSNSNLDDDYIIDIVDGTINYNFVYCDPENFKIFIYNNALDVYSGIIEFELAPNVTSLGTIETCINPVGGTYEGRVFLRTQADVDIFGAYQYSEIAGSITIGTWYEDDNISDLSPLSSLTRVSANSVNFQEDGTGRIRIETRHLTSLYGLHNITNVNGIKFFHCYALEDFTGLEGLTTIGGVANNFESIEVTDNWALKSLDGLNNLVSIGHDGSSQYLGFKIGHNGQLENFDALSNLTEVYGIMTTLDDCGGTFVTASCGNQSLDNLCGLQNLFANGIYGDVNIDGNAYNPTVQGIIDGNCAQ